MRLAGVVEPRMGAALRHHALAHHLCRSATERRASCTQSHVSMGTLSLHYLWHFHHRRKPRPTSKVNLTSDIVQFLGEATALSRTTASQYMASRVIVQHNALDVQELVAMLMCANAKAPRRACATNAGLQKGLASDRSLCFAQVPLETSSRRLAVGTVPT